MVSERDKVGANDVKPGLTGWAQINGRDELEIPEKAELDGVYTEALEAGGLEAAKMDLKCFTGSLHVFGSDDTVVEGGTGEMEREKNITPDPSIDPMDDRFSVLMSVYEKENPEYFDLALSSILVNQTKTPDEFVLVCDGPLTPELDAVISHYQDQFPSILKVHRLPQNGGLGNALNAGLPLCLYDLVARADSDDICVPDRFEKQVSYMLAHLFIHRGGVRSIIYKVFLRQK